MTQLVGIANITPDSFSDGGKSFTTQDALSHIEAMMEEGADIIDIGAESTRPNATPLSPEEEWQRLEPVLPLAIALTEKHKRLISIDTRHADTAAKAAALGVDWLNDVSGFTQPEMISVAAESECDVVVMHALSIPANPAEQLPEDSSAIEDVMHFFEGRVEALEKAGIARERIILDPGIGFGKSAEQSLELIMGAEAFKGSRMPPVLWPFAKIFFKTVFRCTAGRARPTHS